MIDNKISFKPARNIMYDLPTTDGIPCLNALDNE